MSVLGESGGRAPTVIRPAATEVDSPAGSVADIVTAYCCAVPVRLVGASKKPSYRDPLTGTSGTTVAVPPTLVTTAFADDTPRGAVADSCRVTRPPGLSSSRGDTVGLETTGGPTATVISPASTDVDCPA